MTDQEQKEMERFGITSETSTVYCFQDFKYSRLSDAISYAKIVFAADTSHATGKDVNQV